jgi:hypothetical protein
LSTSYEVHRTESGLTALINDLRTNPVYQQTLLSQKEFQEGLLQGAEPREALMVSVEFGAGLLYQIGEKWALFVEPGFHFDLSGKGFGPNNDKLHGISFRTGVRQGILN